MKAEQICRKHVNARPSHIRWLKRTTAKLWRRLARQQLDAAPTKRPVSGWSC